jgi:hypothetical protein
MSLRLRSPLLATATLLATLGLATGPAGPAAGEPLVVFYSGSTHHNTKPAEEARVEGLRISAITGDTFTGHLAGFDITGKIVNAIGSNRKITFTGRGIKGTPPRLKDGKGLISATGLYCVATFKITADPSRNGGLTFAGVDAAHAPLLDPSFGELPARDSGGITALANINNLADGYSGHAHSGTQASLENPSLDFTITLKKPNGKFTGFLGAVPISGKVSTKGKVTFSGGETLGSDHHNVTNGLAQLSAQGNYLLGTFTITGTGVFASEAGKYSFETGAVI